MALLIAHRARCGLLIGALLSGICHAQIFNEYQVKAAFLYSFAKFVEWPPQTYPDHTAAAVTICILGQDPFGSFLNDAVRGKMVGERPLAVYRLANLREAGECQILFIAASERSRMPAVLASVSNPGLLTVGDTPEFASQGGIIGLQRDGDRIRLQVNLPAAEKAKLRISSRVLSLATIVR